MSDDKTTRIRELNDAFRKSGRGGRVVMTSGVNQLGHGFVQRALDAVRTFDDFTTDNDPHGEHDFGSIELDAGALLVSGVEKLFWKIDYYNQSMDGGSGDPSDPAQTTRVMTVMLAEEY